MRSYWISWRSQCTGGAPLRYRLPGGELQKSESQKSVRSTATRRGQPSIAAYKQKSGHKAEAGFAPQKFCGKRSSTQLRYNVLVYVPGYYRMHACGSIVTLLTPRPNAAKVCGTLYTRNAESEFPSIATRPARIAWLLHEPRGAAGYPRRRRAATSTPAPGTHGALFCDKQRAAGFGDCWVASCLDRASASPSDWVMRVWSPRYKLVLGEACNMLTSGALQRVHSKRLHMHACAHDAPEPARGRARPCAPPASRTG